MDNNFSFKASGESSKPITNEEFTHESEYGSIATTKLNPYTDDPVETEVFNNKIMYAVYFFSALLAFLFIYSCCYAYCLCFKHNIEEESRERRLRQDRRRRFSAPRFRQRQRRSELSYSGFLNFNPIQRRLEEKTRQDPNRLSEFVFGRDIPGQDGLQRQVRLPSHIFFDDHSSDDQLMGATGVSENLKQIQRNLEESFEQEKIQESLEDERLFHELRPSERPDKWRLREAFPSYFETDKRERNLNPANFPDMLNVSLGPSNQYAAEFGRQQKIFNKRDRNFRTHISQKNIESEHLADDYEDDSLHKASKRTSTRIISYEKQSVKSKRTNASYCPPQAEKGDFLPDFEVGNRPNKSPEQSSSKYDDTHESYIQENLKKEHVRQDSHEAVSLYAASNRTRRTISHERQESVKPKTEYSSSQLHQSKNRNLSSHYIDGMQSLNKSPDKSSSNENARDESSPEAKHFSKTSRKECQQKQMYLKDMNMNSLSLENLETKARSPPVNRLVQSSPPPSIVRRQFQREREFPRRTS